MFNVKQKFYSCKKLKSLDCHYNMILGERSNGKSYSVKTESIIEAVENPNKKFIYLRRWDLDLKQSLVESYFSDVPIDIITKGESNCITVWQKKIYTAKIDADTGKLTRQKCIGYARALTMAEHYKSGSYPDVENIIYEEFIASQTYIQKEPLELQQFVSTVARRRKIKVWLIGNTISRLCPYFSEWELINIPFQKQGTIEIYEHRTDQFDENGNQIIIKIGVEIAENSGNNSKMFFGSSSKMITSGVWQSEEKPHLPKSKEAYYVMYKIVVKYLNNKFYCELLKDKNTGAVVWYVQPKTTDIQKNTRIITDILDFNPYSTIGFVPLNKPETIAFSFFKRKNIAYSDNLTGTDFENCYKNLLQITNY